MDHLRLCGNATAFAEKPLAIFNSVLQHPYQLINEYGPKVEADKTRGWQGYDA